MRFKLICTQQINVTSSCSILLLLPQSFEKTEHLLIARTSINGLQVPHRRCSKSKLGVEILSLQKGKEILPSSPLKTLCPSVNGRTELRGKGRLSKAMVLETPHYPLILDGANPIIKLLVKNTHVVNSTLLLNKHVLF